MKMMNQGLVCATSPAVYNDFLINAEQFGRVCYESHSKYTQQTAAVFVRRLIKNGHESVLEHFNLTFVFFVDRAIANALVRHRHCAFTQESTHYIDYTKKEQLCFIRQEGFDTVEAEKYLTMVEDIYFADETDAMFKRGMLPLCFATVLVMTTNLREWRHILKLRGAGNDHPQMTALIKMLLAWFKENLPIFVEDI